MKRVIINADDFGLCRSVNEGVILAYQKGVLSSATIMANTPGFDQAVELAKENPGLGVGVHLNIVRGKPLSSVQKIKSLVGSDGRFLNKAGVLIRRIAAKKIAAEEVEEEFRAQIEKVLKAGIQPTHLDSEKHIHIFPSVFKTTIGLAEEYGIHSVRYIQEFRLTPRLTRSLKAFLISIAAAQGKRFLESGIVITDRFYGICYSGRMTSGRLRKILVSLREGTAEIMVHPGFVTPELFALEEVGPYYINKYRETELNALLDAGLRDLLKSREIQLIHFGGL
ncbi:MAG: ChbG/HpnK family deacetylase [Candidatus Aminicenantales bacterium]